MVLVGDDRQAIYGWRGAEIGGMERMRQELDARVLSLSVTHRCARSITTLAARVVPDFEAAPNAPEGTIRTGNEEEAVEGDAVLSRVNAPLVRLALAALRAGKRARIQGKDIGAGLRVYVQSFGESDARALVKAAKERHLETLQTLDADSDGEEIERLTDQLATLEALCENARTIFEVLARIEQLFSDTGPGEPLVRRDYARKTRTRFPWSETV
jgi:hypothetical protein